jgi:hypothetical protein
VNLRKACLPTFEFETWRRTSEESTPREAHIREVTQPRSVGLSDGSDMKVIVINTPGSIEIGYAVFIGKPLLVPR